MKLKIGTYRDFCVLKQKTSIRNEINATWLEKCKREIERKCARAPLPLRTLLPRISVQSERSEDWKKSHFNYARGRISIRLLLARAHLRCSYEVDTPSRSSRPAVFTKSHTDPYRPIHYLIWEFFEIFSSLFFEPNRSLWSLIHLNSTPLDAELTPARPPDLEKNRFFSIFCKLDIKC